MISIVIFTFLTFIILTFIKILRDYNNKECFQEDSWIVGDNDLIDYLEGLEPTKNQFNKNHKIDKELYKRIASNI